MERLVKYFKPDKYELALAIDKHKKTICGRVKIFGKAKSEIVKFHAVRLSVNEVLVDGKKWDFEIGDGLLTLRKVPRGVLCIEVGYHGSLNENMEGAYLSTYEYNGATETIVATQFESHYAREAFPCIDEPGAKVVFELSITTQAEDMVLSNTPEIVSNDSRSSSLAPIVMGLASSIAPVVANDLESHDTISGLKTTTFEPTPRMSTYLLAWVIGKFHGKTVKNAHGVEITTYCALNQPVETVDFANEVAARSLEFFDDNFGVPYPLKKCTQVALPDFEAGAMENWGLVTYRESMLLVSKSATIETKKGVAVTVAHELSHQWFGDLVTMEWWDDLWLNESFASVMEYYAVDALYPDFKIWEDFFTNDCLAALKRDCMSGVQSVHQDVGDPEEIATLFDSAIVYSKGARLMLMVIRLMGWRNFCAGVREYFEEHKYGNTRGDDLWAALGKHAKFDVRKMMHGFIDRPGYPVVKNLGVDFGELKQRRFLLDGKMEDSDWVLPEICEDMSGHYVLELSDAEFNERLSKFNELTLEEKLRLLVDRDLIARTDLVSAATLVPLIKKFDHESSAAVWEIVAMIVNGLKVFFENGSEEELKFKQFVSELVCPKLSELGIKTRKGDDENTLRMRSVLLAMDFYADDKKILRELADMYDDYETLDAEIRSDIISAKIYLEPEMFEKYLEDYKKITDPEIKYELLVAMTLPRDKAELKRALKLLEQSEVVKPQDQLYLFVWLYRNPVIRQDAFSWLMKNWEYVRELSGDKSLEGYPRYTASAVRTKDEFAKWRDFFGGLKNDAALSRAIKVGENEIRARLKLIASDQKDVQEAVKRALK